MRLNNIKGIYFLVTDESIVTTSVNDIDFKKTDKKIFKTFWIICY